MQRAMKILLSAGLGAATMYYLDPAQGRRRRDLARARLEHGRDSFQDATRTARTVGHDVGERAERALHRARTVRHDVGDRAGRLTHGIREAGQGVRERAAGAASSLGSLFERGRSGVGLRRNRSGRSAWRLMGIPVKWLFVAGIGASVMYFLDPSQGLYRRARIRQRFLENRGRGMNGSGLTEDERAPRAAAGPGSGDGPDLRNGERPLPG